jgi:hypothetical protein
MIFGGFKYGEGITVAGVTDKDGQTVVLRNGDAVTSEIAIDHAFLEPAPQVDSKVAKKNVKPVEPVVPTDAAPVEAEPVVEPVTPETPATVDAPVVTETPAP